MARSEARLAVSIWEDADFLALSPSAQRMFMFLLSQRDLAHDGVIALRERRWSKSAAGLTVAQIRRDLDELSTARFVVVDEDAEELLVRSFIRRDKVYRQPNVLRAAADHLETVTSMSILAALAGELARVSEAEDIPEGSKQVVVDMLTITGKGTANPSPNPSGNPSAGTPGERGMVTAVGSASPYPDSPDSPDPVPRDAASRRPPRASARATRLPDDFAVTPEMVEWARTETPGVDGRYATAKFIDYWRGKSGQGATKKDWVATWRNWMRTEAERQSRNRDRAGPRGGTDDRVAGFVEAGRRLQAQFDQQQNPPELTA